MDSLKVILNPIETEGGYGVKPYWRILVNDREVTFHANPFTASDRQAVLHECLNCFYCGRPNLSVRRSGSLVIWFGDDPEDCGVDPGLPDGSILAFDASAYQAQFDKGNIEDLPGLTGGEIDRLLAAQRVPDWQLGLYTIPDLPHDLSGHTLLQLLEESITRNHDAFEPIAPPLSYQRVAVGLELPGVPECILEVGTAGSMPAIRLVALPSFPLWLRGAASVERLCEHVLKELNASHQR